MKKIKVCFEKNGEEPKESEAYKEIDTFLTEVMDSEENDAKGVKLVNLC